jgi:tetratricopeptide (TPR) repeat protein
VINRDYTNAEIQEILKEAYFQLGKVLYLQAESYDDAVSMLKKAIHLDPDNVSALYYLGQSIRMQIERDYQKQAIDYLRSYLLKGAPLGQEEEVRRYLGARGTNVYEIKRNLG